MSRMHKKVLCLICAAVMLVAVTACGAKEGVSTSGTATQPAQSAETTVAKVEPARIKFYSTTNNQEVPTGDLKELPIMKLLQEKTNTIIDLELFEHAKYDEILKTKFAAGEFPDVYLKWSIASELPIQNDLVQDMKSYVDQYGPNLKKNISEAAWEAVTNAKGEVLAIPSAAGTYTGSGNLLFVRKDWMDKAGVTEIPKTPEELLEMWRKFRDCDFNENGKADEIPFSFREKFSWMTNILGMWGLHDINYTTEDGQFLPSWTTKRMKKPLEFLATAYKEKLIDSEILTNTQVIWQNKILQNRVGSWNHTAGSIYDTWYPKLKEANPGKEVGVMAIPTPRAVGYDGPVGSPISVFSTVHIVFKAASEETKIGIVRLFDYLATEEGYKLCKYGIEGDTLIKDASGNYVYDLEKRKKSQTMWFETAFTKAIFLDVLEMVKSTDPKQDEARRNAFAIAAKEGLPNPIIPMPAPKALIENPTLNYNQTIIQEGLARIVTGEKPVDYWDEVIENWRKAGGDKWIEETTQWYKDYYKRDP